jgi:hypothetical protein
MTVYKRYYAAAIDGVVHAFLIDVNDAHRDADQASDREGQTAVLRLWLEHFDNFLGKMAAPKLIDYLETRRFWRQHKEWIVIKTADVPCIAYTAQKSASGDVTLIALGACYQYPNGSEDEWWCGVILPRLRRLQ